MKRLFVTVVTATMIFTSCKKYEVSEPLDLEKLPKVTISGTVYANLDETVPELQFAPEGTKLRISIPYSAYDASNTSGGYYVQTIALDSKGEYSVEIPTVSRGVSATISFADFTAEVRTLNTVGQEVMLLKHFTCASRTVANLGRGQGEGEYIAIKSIYGSGTVNPNDENTVVPTHTVNVEGTLKYLKIDSGSISKNVYATVPTGTEVIAVITLTDGGGRTYKETQTITVAAAGTYIIKTPMVERGRASIKLYSEEFWEMTVIGASNPAQLWRHELNVTIGNIYNVATQSKKDYQYTNMIKVNDI